MVAIDIPRSNNAGVAPHSFGGTPLKTINVEATIGLDSTNAFEGPEKLLEVWFSPSPNLLPAKARPAGLKAVLVSVWEEMLDLVNCKILSVMESDGIDAFLLSESSMFVFPHKLILKTCGTTTLLYGLPRILEIAANHAGFPQISEVQSTHDSARATPYRVFYSRKNFLFPDKQRGPHRNWQDEVKYLDKLFVDGSAYMIGKMNGEHWYLYITSPDNRLTPPASPRSRASSTELGQASVPENSVRTTKYIDGTQDETLEILMTDLDEENAQQFYLDEASAVAERHFSKTHVNGSHVSSNGNHSADDIFSQMTPGHLGSNNVEVDGCLFNLPEELTTEGHALGTLVSDTCGLSDLYPLSKHPDARIDAYLFTPCGFSANGLIPAAGSTESAAHYFTVHVTPEPQCSFASFETTSSPSSTGRTTAELVAQVVRIFRPGRFSVTLFEAKHGTGGGSGNTPTHATHNTRGGRMEVNGYRRVDRIVHDLDGYDLVFRYYERLDWKGGAPRLGEISRWR